MWSKMPDCFKTAFLSLQQLIGKRLRIALLMMVMFSIGTINAQNTPPIRKGGSRIIDDTTKQIYGPNTSRYFFEQDVFYNREVLHPIDTLIKNFHRWNYVQRFNNLYQDLGNVGTAIQPIFYQGPETIGVRSGAHVYDLYWDTEPVRYYDTKSPYSNMRVILGGKGRSMTRATFSRNINPNWNFGFTYRGQFIDKQIQRVGKGDRITRDNYYDAYTAYRSKDSTYRVFFNYRRSFHRVAEFGGVNLFDETDFDLEEFADENAQPWLLNAESNDLRRNTHLFHQVCIGNALQVYHTADWYRQKNKFQDLYKEPTSATAERFYDFVEIARDSTKDITSFRTGRHELGVKGNISKVFYNGYYAIRNYTMQNNNFERFTAKPDTLPHLTYDSLLIPVEGRESYLGGRIALVLDSIGEINGLVEVMQNGNYKMQGAIKSKWFEARLRQMRYAPGFIEQAYRGAHDQWNNNFANTESTMFNGYLHYKSSVLEISPGLTFTRLRNHIFYKKIKDVDTVQQVLPMQSAGNQVWTSPELRVAFTFFRHITLSGQAIYTKVIENADDAIQVPDLFINSQLSYANIFFNGNCDMHGGVEVHWKSDYFANGYDPAIRQFYVQKEFEAFSFPLIDIFLNIKIKRGRVFLKYHNLVQAIRKTGYLPTPYYPGQANIIDFGFDWSFYD
jgi:hypothetical protein